MKNEVKIKVKSDNSKRSRQLILITVCIALMAVVASVSGLNVAQQKLAVEFKVSQNTVLWIINTYTLTLAALLLPLGAVGDRIGRKPVLLAGLLIFGIAGLMSGLAVSPAVMLMSRLLSGIGAALIMPVTLAVITSTFPDEERSRAIGIWTAVAGGGGILGMFLSAVLVDWGSWRWLFVLPVLLAAVAFAMTWRLIPNSKEIPGHKFDIVGSVLSVFAIIGLVFALHEVPGKGWTDPGTVTGLVIGIAGSIAFIFWEKQHVAPLLDIRLFKKRGLSGGSLSLIIVFGVQAGIFVVLFPYFQAVLGWSGLRSTVAMMPMAVLMMAASGLAPKIAHQFGSRLTMAAGAILGSTGAAMMAVFVSVEGGYWSIFPGMLMMGFGMGLSMTPSTEAITSALPQDRQGVASALNDITRELGSALGVALLGALVTSGYSHAMTPYLTDLPSAVSLPAKAGIANALAVAPGLGLKSDLLIHAARESFIQGWKDAIWIGSAVMALLFVYIITAGPETSGQADTSKALDETV
ncbi:MFS transporter [Chryseobacterium vrystaatense]|uniref:MFS transporter n=1 Tax=Chryseobacterium vrystaatense TaxID=307480 RepID=UPI00068E7260|nr:MFS transporter [Chryseobacterium vrystaatense]